MQPTRLTKHNVHTTESKNTRSKLNESCKINNKEFATRSNLIKTKIKGAHNPEAPHEERSKAQNKQRAHGMHPSEVNEPEKRITRNTQQGPHSQSAKLHQRSVSSPQYTQGKHRTSKECTEHATTRVLILASEQRGMRTRIDMRSNLT